MTLPRFAPVEHFAYALWHGASPPPALESDAWVPLSAATRAGERNDFFIGPPLKLAEQVLTVDPAVVPVAPLETGSSRLVRICTIKSATLPAWTSPDSLRRFYVESAPRPASPIAR